MLRLAVDLSLLAVYLSCVTIRCSYRAQCQWTDVINKVPQQRRVGLQQTQLRRCCGIVRTCGGFLDGCTQVYVYLVEKDVKN